MPRADTGNAIAERALGAVRDAAEFERSVVYRALRLFAGDVVFDEVGMLQAGEFDREAVVDMAHHAALRLADA